MTRTVSHSNPAGRTALPPITVDQAHIDRLFALAQAASKRSPEIAEALTAELERARIAPSAEFPTDAVNIGSWAEFTDRTTGQKRTVQLVYPENADIARNRVSVLTPIGAALLGLSPGQRMRWVTPGGGARDLVVTAVHAHDPNADAASA